jgi:hypothetical protein
MITAGNPISLFSVIGLVLYLLVLQTKLNEFYCYLIIIFKTTLFYHYEKN